MFRGNKEKVSIEQRQKQKLTIRQTCEYRLKDTKAGRQRNRHTHRARKEGEIERGKYGTGK